MAHVESSLLVNSMALVNVDELTLRSEDASADGLQWTTKNSSVSSEPLLVASPQKLVLLISLVMQFLFLEPAPFTHANPGRALGIASRP